MTDFTQDPFEDPEQQEAHLSMDDFQDAYQLASRGQRLANFVIDFIVICILWFLVSLVLILTDIVGVRVLDSDSSILDLIIYPLMLVYYFVFELTLNKTIGKMITGTVVVHENGSKPNWKQIAGRSLSRFVPFENFSILIDSDSVGWHDSWPDTRVIKNR